MRVISGACFGTFELCRTGRIFKGEENGLQGAFLPSSLTHVPPDRALNFVRVHVDFCIWVLHSGIDCLVKLTANA